MVEKSAIAADESADLDEAGLLMTSLPAVETMLFHPATSVTFDDSYEAEPVAVPPAAPLASQIETAMAEHTDPWSRAKSIHGIVDEIYQVVAWAAGVNGDPSELGSLVALVHAASRHERQMSELMIGPGVAGNPSHPCVIADLT